MSGPTDPECEGVFGAFGIGWKADGTGNGASRHAQTVFRAIAAMRRGAADAARRLRRSPASPSRRSRCTGLGLERRRRDAAAWHWELPKGFPKPSVPATNPMSDAKVAVGRRLFYDERLSGNGTQSCSSCHQQELAFTDGRAQAVGSTGEVHPRGAQSLVNVVYNATLTWANPALVTLERQMEVPLFSTEPVEMGVTDANKDQVLARIRKRPLVRQALPAGVPALKQPITWTTIIRSIAAFQRSIDLRGLPLRPLPARQGAS